MSTACSFWDEELRSFPLARAGEGQAIWVARRDGHGAPGGLRLLLAHVWQTASLETPGDAAQARSLAAAARGALTAPPFTRLLECIESGQRLEIPLPGKRLAAAAVVGPLLPPAATVAADGALRGRQPRQSAEGRGLAHGKERLQARPALWLEPLRSGEQISGAFALCYDASPPWGEAVRLWGSRFAARIGPLLERLPHWPGPVAVLSRNEDRQPTLFPLASLRNSAVPTPSLGVCARAVTQPGLLLPRPVFVVGVPGAVGVSTEFSTCCETALAVAASEVNVLLHGESGTGKEIVARAIHLASRRHGGPFIGVNCAALPESLFESELFGHKAGAFTGAANEKAGLLEAANGGTFFLDEIGDMPLPLQIKLLRVMQERRVRRIGELESRPVDIRWVAATHKDLAAEIARGSFRLDLYYRLKVVGIDLPPLRRRPEDVAHLLAYFLWRHGGGQSGRRISEQALAALQAYRWPGNVRELENEVCRLLAIHRDNVVIGLGDLSPEVQQAAGRSVDPADLATLRTLDEAGALLEQFLIRKAITACAGRKAAAARRLGLSRQGLYKKIRRHGMHDLLHDPPAGPPRRRQAMEVAGGGTPRLHDTPAVGA